MRPSDFQLETTLVADRIAALRAAAAPAPSASTPRLRRRVARLLVSAGLRLAPELRAPQRSIAT